MIRIREIVDASDPALSGAYALLKQSFHASERVALAEWRGSLRESAGGLHTDVAWHLLVAERDGVVVGLNSGTYLGNVNLGMIGYLAISPTERSRGTGTRLRARLRKRFERDALVLQGEPLNGIIGEVSMDNPWLKVLERRPNVLALNFPYYQPSLNPSDRPSPFVLYYEQLRRVRTRVPVAEIRRILYTVWRRIYRVSRPLDQPAFRAMLRALDARRMVGRLAPPATESS